MTMVLTLLLLIRPPQTLPDWLRIEAPTIIQAAARNGVTSDFDLRLLFAIRQAERGRRGLEFGIMTPRANSLDLQAAHCACTLKAQHKRHEAHACGLDFVACLAARYCPIGADNDPDGLNKNWLRLVRYFMQK